MKKNIIENLIELRKSKGFKTRDSLMASIEKYCSANNEQKFTDKTLQRMEKNQIASEKTIKIVAAVLRVDVNDLKLSNDKKNINIPKSAYSTILLTKIENINSSHFKDFFPKCEKRKFILDIENASTEQVNNVKLFMEAIDAYSKLSSNIMSQINSDEFGQNNYLSQKLDIENSINKIIENLKNDNEKPVYIYFDNHPYVTYWPMPVAWYDDKIKESPSGGFSKTFDGTIDHRDVMNEIFYSSSQQQDFILAPVGWLYGIFYISHDTNIDYLTYDNFVSEQVHKDWKRVGENKGYKNLSPENKIIGKIYKNRLFENLLDDIMGGIDNLPKNYLADSDLTKIYKSEKNKIPSDPDDFLNWADGKSFNCHLSILNDARFYNYVKFQGVIKKLNFQIEDNINLESRKKWAFKTKFDDLLIEDIKQLLPYYDYNEEKVVSLILEGGKKLETALKKSRPVSIEDI